MSTRAWVQRTVFGLICGLASIASGQEPDRPASLATQASRDEAAATAALGRRIALHLERTSLRSALAQLADAAHLKLSYSADEVPVDKQVTLVADAITVQDALHTLLQGTDLAYAIVGGDRLILRPATASNSAFGGAGQQGTGSISGYVRDSATGAPIPRVTLHVEGISLTTQSTADGRFTFTGVGSGEYHVSARRVGYVAKARTVALMDNEAKTLNFDLNQPATKLDEVVTTAVGEQRRYQVGNVITTINVDSLAPTAPATSITDILSGRAPGVDIVETGGLTGSGQTIRIRGESSLVLQGDPIIIVDGIRQDNTAGNAVNPLFGVAPAPSRLNDIDFTQIETIDILKGPAASTEYGTDAANGVIVITTKHGVDGAPQWQASAEADPVTQPQTFPEYFYTWGHTTDGRGVATQCPIQVVQGGYYAQYGFPYDQGQVAGTCAADSVTHFNPLNDRATSVFGTGMRGKYDLSLGGGSEAVRYFVAGNLSNETGIARLPDAFRQEAQAIGLPSSTLKPNSEDQRSLRANTSIKLGSNADVAITAAYLVTDQFTLSNPDLLSGTYSSGQPPDSANNYGYGQYISNSPNGFINYGSPLYNLGNQSSQLTNRMTGGMTANWRPAGWLVTHATVGVDHGSQQFNAVVAPQSAEYVQHGLSYVVANPGQSDGSVSVTEGTTDVYSADLRASATGTLPRNVRSVTSVGLQLASTRTQGSSISAYGVSGTNISVNGASSPSVAQTSNQAATLGGYVEEQLGLADRLYVTGALRIDAGSGFGSSYYAAAYPKVSFSWLAITNGPTTVRLRGAYGANGQQPQNGASLQLYQLTQVYANGAAVAGNQVTAPGNPNLQPERSVEAEGGVDLGLLGNRVSLEFTAYQKTTQKALVAPQLGFDVGNWTIEENLGEVRNTGLEGTASATVIQAPLLTWTLNLNASANHNKLVNILPGALLTEYSSGIQRQVAGYPLYGYWGEPYSYDDLNRDGIIEPDELSLDTANVYIGSSLPTQEVSLGTHVGLWRSLFTVGALFDYQGGYKVMDFAAAAGNMAYPEQNVLGGSYAGQAAYLSTFVPNLTYYSTGEFQNGSYLRFRELSVTYSLSRRVVRLMRVRSLSLTGAVRNVALWTKVDGGHGDPEVAAPFYDGTSSFINGAQTVNNNLRIQADAVPLARYWMVRLNLGL